MNDQSSPLLGDRGAQNERTALAWQRTALSLLAAAAVLSRLTLEHLGPLSVVCVGVAVPVAASVFLESRRRYRSEEMAHRSTSARRGGVAPLLLVVLVAVLAVTELASMWVTALQ